MTKAVISTTLDDKYFYFLPIAAYCWNKIGVDVICFLPKVENWRENEKITLAIDSIQLQWGGGVQIEFFKCHSHKEATYAQCSRLYAACFEIPEDEVLITGDIDMLVFGDYLKQKSAGFDIFGVDLTPPNQYPICYISASVKAWRDAMEINGRTHQQCLDDLLGSIEDQHMRGNYWAKDQEEAFNKISKHGSIHLHNRAYPGTQFAMNRVDRDDHHWRERLNDGLVDAHLWRPGFSEENFPKILELLQFMFPSDNFTWLVEYTIKYRELL